MKYRFGVSNTNNMDDSEEALMDALEIMSKAKRKCIIICTDTFDDGLECATNVNLFSYTKILEKYVREIKTSSDFLGLGDIDLN